MMWRVETGVPPFTKEGYEVTNGPESYWFATREWAEVCQKHFTALDRIAHPAVTLSTVSSGELTDYSITKTSTLTVQRSEYSVWTCYLFGSDNISWKPLKGQEPNWFWRKMQFLCFGNRWMKK